MSTIKGRIDELVRQAKREPGKAAHIAGLIASYRKNLEQLPKNKARAGSSRDEVRAGRLVHGSAV